MTPPRDLQEQGIDADLAISRGKREDTGAGGLPETNHRVDRVETPGGASSPIREREIFVWQQCRWMLTHGMLP